MISSGERLDKPNLRAHFEIELHCHGVAVGLSLIRTDGAKTLVGICDLLPHNMLTFSNYLEGST